MAEKPIRAVIYARISDDREGQSLGVLRQIEDCQRLAEGLGWTLNQDVETTINGVTYKGVLADNDIGASSKSKKRRPGFDDLLAGVNVGEFDGILFYSNSRLTRRPMEFEQIIKLVEQTGVRLASKASGDDDLSTADGRMTARIKASVDAAEAERIGERVKRQQEQRRDKGLPPPSGRAFGFASGGIDVVPEEADAIRLGAKLILDGASLGEVARVWTERDIKPLRADYWSRIAVKRSLTRPRVAGIVEHLGKEVGVGKVEAILDEDTWRKVCAAVSNRSSMARAQYQGREHLLSGLIWCGVCGHRVKINALRNADGSLRPESFMSCRSQEGGCGKVKRNLLTMEGYIFGLVERRLGEVRPFGEEDDTADDREYARLTAQKEKIEARISALREENADPDSDLDPRDYIASLRALRNKVNEISAQLSEFEGVESSRNLEADAMEMWLHGTFEQRREVIEAVVETVTLHPIGKVGPVRAKTMIPETTDVVLN